jgi:hypothetical protein
MPPATTMSSKPLATLAAAKVHGLQARGAEARQRDPGHRFGPAGVEHGGAGDVGALLAHRRDATQHYVVDERGVEIQALLQASQQAAQQPHRRRLVQAAVLLAFAARGADVVVDQCIGHVVISRGHA